MEFLKIIKSQTGLKLKEIIQSRSIQILFIVLSASLIVGIPLFIVYFSPSENSPIEINLIGAINTDGFVMSIHIKNDLAFIIEFGDQDTYGLRIINISNPSQPEILGTYYNVGYPFAVESKDDVVYLTDQSEGLILLDISDLSQPTSIEGQYTGSGVGRDLQIVGDLLFLADGEDGLIILNISNPHAPIFISSYGPGCDHLDVEGEIVYISYGESIRLVDISDPANPTYLGQFFASDIVLWNPTVSDDFIYLAIHGGTHSELKILDARDPTHVVQLSEFDSFGIFQCCHVEESFLFAVNSEYGLYIIDISNPLSPIEIKRFFDGGVPWDMVLDDGLIYLCGSEGLQILQVSYNNQIIPT
ncbi:MAG: LVIVD repeat-containing protein [Candidatus Thorarchaeota archaeon]